MPEEINKNPLGGKGPKPEKSLWELLQEAPHARDPHKLMREFLTKLKQSDTSIFDSYKLEFLVGLDPDTREGIFSSLRSIDDVGKIQKSLDVKTAAEIENELKNLFYHHFTEAVKNNTGYYTQLEGKFKFNKAYAPNMQEYNDIVNYFFDNIKKGTGPGYWRTEGLERLKKIFNFTKDDEFYFLVDLFDNAAISGKETSVIKSITENLSPISTIRESYVASTYFTIYDAETKKRLIFEIKIENDKIRILHIPIDETIDLRSKGRIALRNSFGEIVDVTMPLNIYRKPKSAFFDETSPFDFYGKLLKVERDFAEKNQLKVVFPNEEIILSKLDDEMEFSKKLVKIVEEDGTIKFEYDPHLGNRSKNAKLLSEGGITKRITHEYFTLDTMRDSRNLMYFFINRSDELKTAHSIMVSDGLGERLLYGGYDVILKDPVALQLWRAGIKKRSDIIRGKFMANKESAKTYLDKKNKGVVAAGYSEGGDFLWNETISFKRPFIADNKTDLLRYLAATGNQEAILLFKDKDFINGSIIRVKYFDPEDKEWKWGDPYPLKDKVIARALREKGFDAAIYAEYHEVQVLEEFLGEITENEQIAWDQIYEQQRLSNIKSIAEVTRAGSNEERTRRQIQAYLKKIEDAPISKEVSVKIKEAILSETSNLKENQIGIIGFFDKDDLVYGPSNGGKLKQRQIAHGGKTLNDIPTEYDPKVGAEYAYKKSVKAMDEALRSNKKIHFFLDGINDLELVLTKTGGYADAVTSFELRYILNNWIKFKNNVEFYKDGIKLSAIKGIDFTSKDVAVIPKIIDVPSKPVPSVSEVPKAPTTIEPKLLTTSPDVNLFKILETEEKFTNRIAHGFIEFIEVDPWIFMGYLRMNNKGTWTEPILDETAVVKIMEAEKVGIDDYVRISLDKETGKVTLLSGNHRLEAAIRLKKRIRIAVPAGQSSLIKLDYVTTTAGFDGAVKTGILDKEFKKSLVVDQSARDLAIAKFGKDYGWELGNFPADKKAELESIINKYMNDVITMGDGTTKIAKDIPSDLLHKIYGTELMSEGHEISNILYGSNEARKAALKEFLELSKKAVADLTKEDLAKLVMQSLQDVLIGGINSFKGHSIKLAIALQRAMKDGYRLNTFRNYLDLLQSFNKFNNLEERILRDIASKFKDLFNKELTPEMASILIDKIKEVLSSNLVENYFDGLPNLNKVKIVETLPSKPQPPTPEKLVDDVAKVSDDYAKRAVAEVLEIPEEKLIMPEYWKGGWDTVLDGFSKGQIKIEDLIQKELTPQLPAFESLLHVPTIPNSELDEIIEALNTSIKPSSAAEELSKEALMARLKDPKTWPIEPPKPMTREVANKLNVMSKLNSIESIFGKIKTIMFNISINMPSLLQAFIEDPQAFNEDAFLAKFSEKEIRTYFSVLKEYEIRKTMRRTVPYLLNGDGITQQLYDQFIIALNEKAQTGKWTSLFEADGKFAYSDLLKIDMAIDAQIAQHKAWLDSISEELILQDKNYVKRAGKFYHKGTNLELITDNVLESNPFQVEKNSGLETWKLQASLRKLEWFKKYIYREGKKLQSVAGSGYRNVKQTLDSLNDKAKAAQKLNELVKNGTTMNEDQLVEELRKMFDKSGGKANVTIIPTTKISDVEDYPINVPWELWELSNDKLEYLREILYLGIASAILTSLTSQAIWALIDFAFTVKQIMDIRKEISELRREGRKNVFISPKPKIGSSNKYIDFIARVRNGTPPSEAIEKSGLNEEIAKRNKEQKMDFLEELNPDKLSYLGAGEKAAEIMKKTGLLSKEEEADLQELLDYKYTELQEGNSQDNLKGWRKSLRERGPSFDVEKMGSEFGTYKITKEFIDNYVWKLQLEVLQRAKKRRIALIDALRTRLNSLSDGSQSFKGVDELQLTDELSAYIESLRNSGEQVKELDKIISEFDSLSPEERLSIMNGLLRVSNSANEKRAKLKDLFDNLSEDFKNELGIGFEEDKIAPKKKQTPIAPEEDPTVIPPPIDTSDIEGILKFLNGDLSPEKIKELLEQKEKGEIKPFVKKSSYMLEPEGGEIKDSFYSAIYVPPILDSIFNKPLSPGKKPVVNEELGSFVSNPQEEPFKGLKFSDSIVIPKEENKPWLAEKQKNEKYTPSSDDKARIFYDLTLPQVWNEKDNRWESYLDSIAPNISDAKKLLADMIENGTIKNKDDAEVFLLKEATKRLKEDLDYMDGQEGGGVASAKLVIIEKVMSAVDIIYKKSQNDSVSREKYNAVKEERKKLKKLFNEEKRKDKKEKQVAKHKGEIAEKKRLRELVEETKVDEKTGKLIKTGKVYTQGNLERKNAIDAARKAGAERQRNQTAKERWKEYLKKNPKDANSNYARVKAGMQKTNGDSAGCVCSKCKKLMDKEKADKEAATKLAALLKAAKEAAAKAAEEAKKLAEKIAAEEAAKKAEEEAAKKAEEEAKKAEELQNLLYQYGIIPLGVSPKEPLTIEEMEQLLKEHFEEEEKMLSQGMPKSYFELPTFIAATAKSPDIEIGPNLQVQERNSPVVNNEGATQKEPLKQDPKPDGKKKKEKEPEIGSKGKGVVDYYHQKQEMTKKSLDAQKTPPTNAAPKANVIKPGGTVPNSIITPRGGEVL